MKKLLIAVICLLMMQTADAQIAAGVKLGLSTNDVTKDDVIGYRNNTDSLVLALSDAGFGLHGGIFVRIPLTKMFYVQVEPVLGSNRFNYTLTDVDTITGVAASVVEGYESFRNLDLNLIVGLQLKLPADVKLRAHAGLVPSITLSSQSDLFDTENYMTQWNNMKFGYLLGAGVDLGAFTVDVNFVSGLGQYGNDITIGANTYQLDTRPSSTVVTVGYKLFGKE